MMTLVLAILAVGCSENNTNDGDNQEDSSNTSGEVAATVNNVTISQEDFEETLNRYKETYELQGYSFEGEEGEILLTQLSEMTINSMVQEEVLMQEAEKNGFTVTEEEIQEQYDLIRGEYPTEEEFNTALEINAFTVESFKESLRKDMVISDYLESVMPEITITEEEVGAFYDEQLAYIEAQYADAEEKPEMPALEEIYTQIEEQLLMEKQQEQSSEVINELMENSEVEINV